MTTLPTWRFIWRLIRREPGVFALALLCAVATFGLPVPLGLILRAFFDTLTGQAPAGVGIGALIALFVATEVGSTTISLGLSFCWGTFRYSSLALLRHNLLRAALRGHAVCALTASPGAALSRFRDDVDEVVESIDAWIDFFGRVIIVMAALVIMLRLDALITLAVFLPIIVVVTIVNLARNRLVSYRQQSRAALARVTGFLGDLFAATLALKAASATPHAVARLRVLGEARRRAALKDSLFAAAVDGVNSNMVNLGTGAILLLAAHAMRAGQFTVGDFALFVTYLEAVTWFGDEIARWLVGYRQAGVSLERLTALVPGATTYDLAAHTSLNVRRPVPSAPPHSGGPARAAQRLARLDVTGLTYRYPGTTKGIVGIDLGVTRGSFVVVTGRIGAGKTTLLHALLGLLPAQAGAISWNGKVVVDPAAFFGPPRSAFTPQAPRLFSGTLRDNILLGTPEDDVITNALYAAALERDVAALERGSETVVGPRGVRLSGGQIQRAAAARMFVRAPDLYVFDDLSSALDVETERVLWDRLFARPGTTCLAVSHRRAVLQRADRIVVLKEGQVVAAGPLAELLTTCAEMQRLWAGEVEPATSLSE
ncbi:MAG TPA: ABC transporter ATP-binding protein [Thermomicrobiales bacterium]|nr:ABC transporter ATP-binding protein [Thermomicrobiales bacterium]